MSASRTLKLNILAETKDLTDGLKKANQQVTSSQSGIAAAFDKVKVAAAAAAAAAGAYAIKLAVDGVKAAIEDTAAQERLANALRNTTEASDAQIRSVENQILKLSLATGVADDQLRPAFQRLATATGDLGQSQSLLNLALDISATTGKSVESVTNALGRAYEGSTTALTRLGIGLSAAQIETLGLEGAIGQLSQTFGGAAAVQAQTLQGQIQRLRVSFDETKESIGVALLPVLTDLFKSFANFAIPAAQKFADVFQNRLIPYLRNDVFPAFSGLVDAIKGIGDAFDNTSDDVKESNRLIVALQTTIREFVPTTLGALEVVTDAWATFLDVLNRARAFISGDLATATREFNNRFRETKEVTNNVSDATIRAYKEFEFWNKQTRNQTIPNLVEITKAQNSVASSTRSTTAAIEQQVMATDSLTRAQQRLAADPTGAKTVAAAKGLRAGRAIAGLGAGVNAISLEGAAAGSVLEFFADMAKRDKEQTGRDLGLENAALLNVRFSDLIEAGLGGASFDAVGRAIQQLTVEGALTGGFLSRPTGSQSLGELVGGRANQINININGTVVNPEGTARAITNVLQNSNARSGVGVLTPVLGLE